MDNELERRLRTIRRGMRKRKLDGMLVMDRANTYYTSRFRCTSSFLLLAPNGGWFITDFRYLEAARQTIDGLELVRQKDPASDLARLIRRAGIRRLGVESSLPFGVALKWKEAFSGVELIVEDAPLREARARKSREEIALIRAAVHGADAAFADLAADAAEGWTEIDVRNRLRRLIERHGGFGESFDSIIAAGPNASRPHAAPGDRVLRRGDIVQVDTGMVLNHYCSDLSRMMCVGRPTSKMKTIHQIVLDAQRKAIDAIRAGVRAKDVDARARDHIAKKGYGARFGHGLGHGVGLEIHEAPTLNARSADVLEEGMVVTVEPGIYLPGWGGVRIEDMVVVKSDGCEILTTAPKEIAVI